MIRDWIKEGPLTDEKVSRAAAELYADTENPFSAALADDLVALWAVIRTMPEPTNTAQ